MSAIIVLFEDGKWQITTGSKVLGTAPNWTSAIDVARSWLGKLDNSMTTDCDVIELHKKNGTVQIFGGGRRPRTSKANASNMVNSAELSKPALYIARIQKSFDVDTYFQETHTSLLAAVKCLPRTARSLNWTAVETLGYDSHVILNGLVVSIERYEQ